MHALWARHLRGIFWGVGLRVVPDRNFPTTQRPIDTGQLHQLHHRHLFRGSRRIGMRCVCQGVQLDDGSDRLFDLRCRLIRPQWGVLHKM